MAPKKKKKLESGKAAPTDEGEDEVVEEEPEDSDGDENEGEAPATAEGANSQKESDGPPPEPEVDAPDDARPKITEEPVFLPRDRTPNLMPSNHGLLSCLSEGGMQHLAAGARASIGIKSGRYAFEVRGVAQSATDKQTKQMLRIGFSVANAPPLLGDSDDSVSFDLLGLIHIGKKRSPIASAKSAASKAAAANNFWTGNTNIVLTAVLNMNKGVDGSSDCTVSFFRSGVRVAPPQALPESLSGRALYPTVTFKNMVVQVSFGPTLEVPLPFRCRALRDAATADVVVETAGAEPDRREAVVPILIPGEGCFYWLDSFLEQKPDLLEISDRAIEKWAIRSGATPQHSKAAALPLDKRAGSIGIQGLEDGSVKRALSRFAVLQRRDVVVMEARGNLTKQGRADALLRYPRRDFRRVAKVMIGKPPEAFLKRIEKSFLSQKQEKLNQEFEVNKLKRAVAAKKKETAKENEDGEVPAEEPAQEAPPEAELTEEEAEKIRNGPLKRAFDLLSTTPVVHDVLPQVIIDGLKNFSLPEEDEGFDSIVYEWSNAADSKAYFNRWVRDLQLTTKIEDIQPDDLFKEKWQEWQQNVRIWRQVQKEYMNPARVKAREQERSKDAAVRVEEECKRQELDVYGLANINDIGNGEPMYAHFTAEDWALAGTRFELFLLIHSFPRCCKAPDRPGMHIDNLSFYYTKLFKKPLNVHTWMGLESPKVLTEKLRDTVVVGMRSGVLETYLPADIENNDIFLKITEEARLDRQRRVTTGDETAKLALPTTGAQTAGGLAAQLSLTPAPPTAAFEATANSEKLRKLQLSMTGMLAAANRPKAPPPSPKGVGGIAGARPSLLGNPLAKAAGTPLAKAAATPLVKPAATPLVKAAGTVQGLLGFVQAAKAAAAARGPVVWGNPAKPAPAAPTPKVTSLLPAGTPPRGLLPVGLV